MTRADFCDEVKEIICKGRQDQHGDPEDTFARIATLWNAYLSERFGHSIEINRVDVAMMMCCFKIARSMGNQDNLENYLDLAGYAGNAAEIVSTAKMPL